MQVIDQRTITVDGIEYSVTITPDDDITEPDGDCYDDADRATFGDTWSYVGVIVTPVIGGQEISAAADSLWRVEYGSAPGWDREQDMDYYLTVHPVPNMISEARAELRKFRDSFAAELAGLPLDDCTAYNPAERRGNVANAHCLRAAGHDMPHRDLDGREWQ